MLKDARSLDTLATAFGFVQVLVAESWGAVSETLFQSADNLGIAIRTIGTCLLLANLLGMGPLITHCLGELCGFVELILNNAQILGRY